MDTNDLVSKLVDDLKPVKQLPSAKCCSIYWSGMAAFLVAVAVIVLGGVRPDFLDVIRRPVFLFENTAMLVAGLLAASVAFQLRVPQAVITRPIKGLLATASAIWVFEVIRCYINAGDLGTEARLDFAHYIHDCLIDLTLIMVIPAAFMFFMLKKGATTQALWAGYAALLATASFAALGMRYLCPVDDPAHLLIWHFLPVLAYAMIGPIVGRYLLRW